MLPLRGLRHVVAVARQPGLFITAKRTYFPELEKNQQPDPAHTTTKVVESTDDFHFVEALLGRDTVPAVPEKSLRDYPTPSGWIPPAAKRPDLPYFVGRTRYHNLPIYLKLTDQGFTKKLTDIRKVQGDIWALEQELLGFIRKFSFDGLVATQVSEVHRYIRIKGDWTEQVKGFLLARGF